MNKPEKLPARGRPREFCVDMALSKALGVFWAKGYDGASLNDLTEAMGITRPSLYAAFGNKEALFRKALDLYEREKMCYVTRALGKPTAREVADTMIQGALDNATGPGEPHGCLRVISSVACGHSAQSIQQEIVKRGNVAKAALVDRFRAAQQDGDLPPDIDPEGLTLALLSVLQGISLQANQGASRAELELLADTVGKMWPSH